MIVPQAVEELVNILDVITFKTKLIYVGQCKMEIMVAPTDMQQLADQLRQELDQRVTTDTLTAASAQ